VLRDGLPAVVAVTAAWRGAQAGAALVYLLVIFPGRARLGSVAYARFARATDLGAGRTVDPVLGIGGLALSWAALALALAARAPRRVCVPLGVGAVLATLGGLVTLQAAPVMMQIGRTPDEEARVAPLLDRFFAWGLVRGVLLQLTFWATLWALAARARALPGSAGPRS
jgi:hypothetical protein